MTAASRPYPPARRADVVDVYHGTPIADPYRWLEDPDSAETRAWIDAQNALTRAYLDAVPARDAIHARLTELWDYPQSFAPARRGAWYFYYHNDGLQNQAVLYRTRALGQTPEVALDPNQLSPDGTAAITSRAIARDGSHLAYGVSFGGSDRQEIRIRDLDRGREYPEILRHCRFAGIAWTHDAAGAPTGFYYNRYPEPDPARPDAPPLHNYVCWHRLNTPQAADERVYARPDAPTLGFGPRLSEDGRFLILHVWESTSKNRLYYQRLDAAGRAAGEVVRLIDTPDANFVFVGSAGDTFYLHTDWAAPNGRVVAVDLAQPARADWQDVVPESSAVLDACAIAGSQLVVRTMEQAAHRLRLLPLADPAAPAVPLPLPPLCAVTDWQCKPGDPELFLKVESYLDPGTVYRYDLETAVFAPVWQTAVSFDAARFVTRQVRFPSKDGTAVTMFLTHARDLPLSGEHPLLLYGYGGFNVSHTPAFSPHVIQWLERGGIFADVNLRGGGEYGESWHEAGMLDKKQTVFDDFVAAAEWLVANGYTQPRRLAIIGRSNGGLLTAAVMLQRPELFGAVLSIVPVTDMLRFHRFTAGRYWTVEYGNAEDDPDQFRFLVAYSPLHNVRPGTAYPPVLLTTADGDDRVVPLHAMKFAAALQAASRDVPDANPALIRIDTNSGHGLGKPVAKWIAEWSDVYAFLARTVQQGI